MICHTCVYCRPAPAYPDIPLCTANTAVRTINKPETPYRYWTGWRIEMAMQECRGRGYKPREK